MSRAPDPRAADALRLGAIDAGSNAIRMVIADASDPAALRVLEAERAPVRLGHGAFTRGELDPHVIDAAVAAFARFRARFDAHGVTRYRAVATSAVRTAANRDALLHRLYHEAGIELEVIDGDEEARLVRKAVLRAYEGRTPPRLILDLGGGSLEVNLRSDDGWTGCSLPVGTVRLIETFGLTGAIGHDEAGMVRRYTATLLQTVLAQVAAAPDGGQHVVLPGPGAGAGAAAAVCGGNAEALAKLLGPTRIDARSGGVGAGGDIPGFELAALEAALPDILSADVGERMRRLGVRRDRAEVMGVAALVLATVSRALRLVRLDVPGVGVRDALLLDLAERAAREQARADDAQGKALLTAARTFAHRVGHDISHGENVAMLARSMFDQLTDVHGLPPAMGTVLEVAALLHDVGEVVNPRSHHKHSEYMIRHGRIPGLVDPWREMVALLARTHRKSPPDLKKHLAFAELSTTDRDRVRVLAALLRLADGLDTEHRQAIEDVFVSRLGDTIALDLVVSSEAAAGVPAGRPDSGGDGGDDSADVTPVVPGGPGGPGGIDPAPLLRKADLFEQELGYKVTFTVGTAGPPSVPPR